MDVVDEQIDVTSRAFLGVTASCARCHDHKFDPIPQADYYAVAGIFRSSETLSGYLNRQGGNRGGFKPEYLLALDSVPAEVVAQEELTVDPQVQRRLKRQEQQLAQVKRQIRQASSQKTKRRQPAAKRKKVSAQVQNPLTVDQGKAATPTLAELRAKEKALQRAVAKTRRELNGNNNGKKKKLPKVDRTANFAMGVRERAQAEDCRVNIRGEARTLGDSVPRGFLQVMCDEGEATLEAPEESGRRELADWIASPENPLTARVMVNRLWHHLMGQGLVRTVDNFGKMGERPSHPELLDHLALRFVENGWSIKSMIREIMMSAAYRRSSDHDEAAHAVDPENRLAWRANVRRLQAEPLRDALLAIGGTLELERPEGSPVMFRALKDMRRATQLDKGWEHRRTVYLPILRGLVPQFLEVFDFAEPSQVMGRRNVTTVSTQALYFMNSPFLMEQSRLAAGRLLQADLAPAERLGEAYRRCFGRWPTEEEREASREFLQSSEAKDAPRERWAGLFQALFASAEFRYVR
jgi:hypothetical protein